MEKKREKKREKERGRESESERERQSYHPVAQSVCLFKLVISEPLCKFDLEHNAREIKMEMYHNMAGESLTASGVEGDLTIEGARVQVDDQIMHLYCTY